MVSEFRISPFLVIPMKLAILDTQKHFRFHMYFEIWISIAYFIYPIIPCWKQQDNWIPLSICSSHFSDSAFPLLYLAAFSETCFTLTEELLPLEQLLEGLKVHSGKKWFKNRFLHVNGLFLPLKKTVEHIFSHHTSEQWFCSSQLRVHLTKTQQAIRDSWTHWENFPCLQPPRSWLTFYSLRVLCS